ncbi:MAG: NAD-dependent epimerase/dehydratase family protein [Chloroflexi bacterium]|nr:NAD-dependent epimerase/dehydratase family protein [Chloroflexota bacterium]MCL5273902.1 NAD-dependent epimerase/dehydratase family protein [Chloroflexota bacterium]
MNICILGATGFIGGHIARAAANNGWHVRGVRRNPASMGAISDLPVEWATGDLFDVDSLRRAMAGCDVIYHAAAAYPQDFRHIDRAVALARAEMDNVLQAARTARVSRIIYTSSITTVGQPPPGRLADEHDQYRPGTARSAYYEAKYAMERLALRESRNPDLVVLLPTAVFGPGDIKPTTGVVIRDAMRGRFPVYFEATINAVDVRDVAASHIAAVERGRRGERYILGGHNVTIYELLATATELARMRPPRIKLSRAAVASLIRLSDNLPFMRVPENFRTFQFWQPVSSQKAQDELGHTVRNFSDTVRDTIAWFKQVETPAATR